MRVSLFAVFLALPLLCPVIIGCTEHKYVGGSYYFESFSGYNIPFVPQGHITKAEAFNRNTYYVATYDSDGKLLEFKKVLNGKTIFIDKYIYNNINGKLVSRELTKENGEKIINSFD